MIQSGRVVSSDSDQVLVQVVRQTSCGDNCNSCTGTCHAGIYIATDNTINAQQGDVVNLETESKSIYKIAFLMYIVPLIITIIGLTISKSLFPGNYVNALSDTIALIIGLVLYILSMYMIHLYTKNKTIDYKLSFRRKY